MFELIVLCLATYGLSSLLTSYDGPGDAFLKLRNKYPRSALKCNVCTSVYVGTVLFFMAWFGLAIFLVPLAIVGFVIILEDVWI